MSLGVHKQDFAFSASLTITIIRITSVVIITQKKETLCTGVVSTCVQCILFLNLVTMKKKARIRCLNLKQIKMYLSF